jgi:hypothetical protein
VRAVALSIAIRGDDQRWRKPRLRPECGHWYARALASYALLEGMTGVRYDALDATLTIEPHAAGCVRTFLATATGFGTVDVRNDTPFVDVRHGTIDVGRIECLTA